MMSSMERRPHWDDDLIEAVMAEMPSAYDIDEGDFHLYEVIAAVEDWQSANGLERVGELLGRIQDANVRAIEAEAAIQRVRDLCERIRTDTYDLRPDSREALRAHERLAVAHMVLHTLDGPA